jgi:two-component system phosphate regulon sensor histidine kinase PhoR
LPVPERLPLVELVRDPEMLDLLAGVLDSGGTLTRRLRIPAANDRSFEIQAAPLGAQPRRGAIAVLHDITELERLERVRKDFVANVSHELRTPLAAIQGYTETLLDGAIEDRENNRKFLEVVHAQAVRLNRIAADLLILSQLESGKPAAPEQTVSIREAIEAAIRAVEPAAQLRRVNVLRGRIEDVQTLGSQIGVEQALVNLLDNAVKFNRPGGEVRAEVWRTPEGQARITVADSGIGIPSGDLSRIFERFYRVDKSRSREMGGTGLGLSIVKHAIERMNGRVTVESQLGKGSTFTIFLPAC